MTKKHLDISVHPFAAAGLFLLFFAAPRTYAFAVFSSVLLHEAGHLTAALLLRKRLNGIKIVPTGINLELSAASSYTEEFLIASAGPIMNLLYALLSFLLPREISETVRGISLVLACINLLPLSPLDGGRTVYALVSQLFGERAARSLGQITNLFLLSALWVLSLYIFFYSGANFTLLLFCAYLFSYIVVKKL